MHCDKTDLENIDIFAIQAIDSIIDLREGKVTKDTFG
jgi:hypothetical protein